MRPSRQHRTWSVAVLAAGLLLAACANTQAEDERRIDELAKELERERAEEVERERADTAAEASAEARAAAQARAEAEAQAAADEAAWQAALLADTEYAYVDYLTAFPDGRHRDDAIAALEGIYDDMPAAAAPAAPASPQSEEELWVMVREADTVPAYEYYLGTYPDGAFAVEARARLMELASTTTAGDEAGWTEEEEAAVAETEAPETNDTRALASIGRGVTGAPAQPPPPPEEDEAEFRLLAPMPEPAAPEPRAAVREPVCDINALNEFDWPPPEPSTKVTIPRALLLAGIEEETPSVARVAERLETALLQAGYVEYGYQSIGCTGFAMVTRMERIDEQGRPMPDEVRFMPPGSGEKWSLSGYLSRLFFAPPGYYRQIVFAATERPYDPQNLAEAPTRSELDEMMAAATATVLPESFDVEGWTRRHQLHALIYEFRKGANDRDVVQVNPSRFGGAVHVRQSGIYSGLTDE